MAQPKNTQRLSEVEYCLSTYFYTNIVPVMKSVKSQLQTDQAKEVADYTLSFAGIMRSLGAAGNPYAVDDTMQYLRITGEHCSKTAEDYVEMVQESVIGNTNMRDDLLRLAGEWRNAIIADVGRAKYDQISEKLGADLALAYVDYRMEQMIIDKMVTDQMPKSTFDYIIRKGAAGSLLGLPQEMLKSPLEAEIEARGEAAYKPSTMEKVGARAVSAAADAVSLGGIYSWASLGTLTATEVAFAGLEKVLDKGEQPKGLTVEECISKALYNSSNIFPALRKDNWKTKTYENDYIKGVNDGLSCKMAIAYEKPIWEIDYDNAFSVNWNAWQNPDNNNPLSQWWQVSSITKPTSATTTSIKPSSTTARPNVPMVIAPGHEQEYLDWKEEYEQAQAEGSNIIEEYTVEEAHENEPNNEVVDEQHQQVQEPDNNNFGWSELLQSVGLDGLGDIGRNLPYVIATLPDMLIGLLTGKTDSVNLKKDMIPMASILLGLFIKNPLLKMVLIGMGGANLLNKMGHEAIERQEPKAQYRQYADEPLNPRVANPVLQGNTLIATIDNIPCSITIPDNAAAAYKAGALPLNTLCNAILARNDQMNALAQQNYRNVEVEQTLQRDRGITLK